MVVPEHTYDLVRFLVRSVGRASDGIRLSLDTGFTSGRTLDYVYRNQPAGRWLFGPVLDRAYLRARGWEAVRVRRRHVERLVAASIRDIHAGGAPASVVDIAAGPGSYLLEVLGNFPPARVSARCRDIDERWLAEGRAEAARRGIANISFERGDAFDAAALRALSPRPNVAVASGFYDWITDDEAVRHSLGLLHATLPPGGFLVLTSQARHHNLRLVSRVFADHNQQPLRMKMRPTAVMESWLDAAGFRVCDRLTDEWGCFDVFRARRAHVSEV